MPEPLSVERVTSADSHAFYNKSNFAKINQIRESAERELCYYGEKTENKKN